MSYSRRTWIAFAASCLLHLLVLGVGLRHVEAIPVPVKEPLSPPIVFNFVSPPEPEPEPETIPKLIETATPTTEEVADTDLISDKNSKARDESDKTGERIAPNMEEEDDFDQLATPPAEASPEKPMKQAVKLIPPTEQKEVAEDTSNPSKSVVLEPTLESLAESPSSDSPKKELPERIQIAAAPDEVPTPEKAAPEPLAEMMHIAKGRANGGTSESGVMSFEAKSHELGEYMLEVRRRVEQQWHAAMQLQYQGVKHAEALISCSIRPDGTLEYARIKQKGNSMPYAILCREAVVRAAPYPKLPFDVPAIYKSRNIKITWRFTYM